MGSGRPYRYIGSGAKTFEPVDASGKVLPDGTLLVFSGGEIKLQADEWLMSSLVEEAFLAFMDDKPFPQAIHWREMSAMLEDQR